MPPPILLKFESCVAISCLLYLWLQQQDSIVQSCEASLVVYTNLFWAGQPTDNTLLLVGKFYSYNFRFSSYSFLIIFIL
jgi:hypothetical protein